jgi:hypothetical protein
MSNADKSYTDVVEYPHAQIRFSLDTNGVPRRFLIQLEYRVEDDWTPVVRFDHNPAAPTGHDITEEGLHMDVFRDGEKVRVKRDFPPVSLSYAPRYCVLYIKNNAEPLLRRFEQWHNLKTTR